MLWRHSDSESVTRQEIVIYNDVYVNNNNIAIHSWHIIYTNVSETVMKSIMVAKDS